jgi:hypothetical protein
VLALCRDRNRYTTRRESSTRHLNHNALRRKRVASTTLLPVLGDTTLQHCCAFAAIDIDFHQPATLSISPSRVEGHLHDASHQTMIRGVPRYIVGLLVARPTAVGPDDAPYRERKNELL